MSALLLVGWWLAAAPVEQPKPPVASPWGTSPEEAAVQAALHLEIRAPRRVRSGEPLKLQLVIANTSTRTVTVMTGDHPLWRIAKPDGEVVVRSPTLRTSVGYMRRVSPGKPLAFGDPWDANAGMPPLAPGKYLVQVEESAVSSLSPPRDWPLEVLPARK